MRVLLIHRYYWPDTPPYAAMLRSISENLLGDGHDVSVLSSQPSYKSSSESMKRNSQEIIDGTVVHRISLLKELNRGFLAKLFNMVYFSFRILLFLLVNRKFDLVMVSTAPPVMAGFATALGVKIRGGKFVYHCMDIHPEIGSLSGEFSNPLVFKLLRFMDNFSCNIAEKVIVLSNDMRLSLMRRVGYAKKNIVMINNFSMPNYDKAAVVDECLLKKKGKFRLLFAGNVGRFQGLEVFIDAMKLLTDRLGIELVFLGEGAALARLIEQAEGLPNVKFIPHQQVNIARAIIADADMGIVSLRKEIYKYAFPSKTMTYLDEGCPLLINVEKDSELARFVVDNELGTCVSSDSAERLAVAIKEVYLNREGLVRMREAAKAMSEHYFSKRVVMDKWSLLVRQLGEES